jgi:hypothetical protein
MVMTKDLLTKVLGDRNQTHWDPKAFQGLQGLQQRLNRRTEADIQGGPGVWMLTGTEKLHYEKPPPCQTESDKEAGSRI